MSDVEKRLDAIEKALYSKGIMQRRPPFSTKPVPAAPKSTKKPVDKSAKK